MARHVRHPINSTSQRRRTTWARDVATTSLAANGNYVVIDLLGQFKAAGGITQGATVVRTHLQFSITSATASGDTFAWGTLRGQNTDVGLNIAGAPVPDTDPYEDWSMWRTETACANTGGASNYWWGGANEMDFDIKSQRKIPEIQMAYLLVVRRITVAAAALNFTTACSTLLKLP